jgi:hypothetical protein
MGVGGQRHAPAALPPGKTRYPMCSRLGGPHGRSGQVYKISSPPGFDPRTVQPKIIQKILNNIAGKDDIKYLQKQQSEQCVRRSKSTKVKQILLSRKINRCAHFFIYLKLSF